MEAIGLTEFGGPEVLHVVSLPLPEPGAGEVRIRVHAVAVNPTDITFRAGGRATRPDRDIRYGQVFCMRSAAGGGSPGGAAGLGADACRGSRAGDRAARAAAVGVHRPGHRAAERADLLQREFPADAGGTARIMLAASARTTLVSPAAEEAIGASLAAARIPGVIGVSDPFTSGSPSSPPHDPARPPRLAASGPAGPDPAARRHRGLRPAGARPGGI